MPPIITTQENGSLMRKVLASTVAAFAMVGALAGCGTAQPAAVVQPADVESSTVDESSPATAAPETTPVGTTVSVANWDVKVTKVVKDADPLVKAANMYNDPADGQYVLVTYKATYRGTERKVDIESDLTWSFTDSAQVSHDSASQVTPADDKPSEARTGGTVTGDVAFDIPAKRINGGLITVEGYDEEFNSVYADFTF